jgi:hypothetical protein
VGQMIEIKIGKMRFPVISIASLDDDFLIVFRSGDALLGQSVRTKTIAQLRFRNGNFVWGNKTVRFI